MPAGAVVAPRVLVGMDDHECGIAVSVRCRRMDVQFAEAATEREMLFGRGVLVAHEEHKMTHPSVVDFLEKLIVKRFRQVDAVHGGADFRRQRFDSMR